MKSMQSARRRWLATPPARASFSLASVSLALMAPCAQAAAFLPNNEAAPATGELSRATATPAEPLVGDGIQWTLAPWRIGGSMAVDLRALRLEDGRNTRQAMLTTDVDLASYIWQPWFVQVRLGVGFVGAQLDGDAQAQRSLGSTMTGRAAITVFPASRFPFELRADVSDSRTGGIGTGDDYRSRRLSLSQGWRPLSGNLQLQLQADHSELSDGRSRDTLRTFSATALNQRGPHTVDLGYSYSDHHRSDTDEHTRLQAFSARHTFNAAGQLNVESFASWNEVRLSGSGSDFGSDVRQLSTFATWRARSRPWAGAGLPLVAASARWVQARTSGAGNDNAPQLFNATVGVSQELSPAWRAALSATASELNASTQSAGRSLGGQGSLTWAPATTRWGPWRYGPSASVNASVIRDITQVQRTTAGVQASHGLTRELPLDDSSSLSLSFTQSAAVLNESAAPEPARALAHGASVGWQRASAAGTQSFGGLSYSDSLSLGSTEGRFQLVNAQLSQRSQLTRHSFWSANLTLQQSRNRSTELDAFSGDRRQLGTGWQRFYSGSLNYEHQRAFGVPRLRHSLLMAFNSQALERRALGDVDASRERITASLESRLDYAIGRLDTRLALRVARVDGRQVTALQARAQRRF